MKTRLTYGVMAASLFMAGCLEEQDQAVPYDTSYPNINLPARELSTRIVNDGSGVGVDTQWICVEPPSGDGVAPASLFFQADGTGVYTSAGIPLEMTWTLKDRTLEMVTTAGTRTYNDVSMPIPSRMTATALTSVSQSSAHSRLSPIPQTAEPVACVASLSNNADQPIALTPDVFANGTDSTSLDSRWACVPPPGTSTSDFVDLSLSIDGKGFVSIGQRLNTPVSLWQVSARIISVLAADGTSLTLDVSRHDGVRFVADITVDGQRSDIDLCELVSENADPEPVVDNASSRTVTYRYSDSSIPPPGHRSYTLIVNQQTATLTFDSYGDILGRQSQVTDLSELNEVLNRVAQSNLPVSSDAGCVGGPTLSLEVTDANLNVLRSIRIVPCDGNDQEVTELRSIIDPVLSGFDLSK